MTTTSMITPLQMHGDQPLVTHENFVADFGPTAGPAIASWLEQFKLTLRQVDERTVPEILAIGKTGRVVIRVWSPNPVEAVYTAEQLVQDGPKVVLL